MGEGGGRQRIPHTSQPSFLDSLVKLTVSHPSPAPAYTNLARSAPVQYPDGNSFSGADMTTPAARDNWVADLAFEVALGYYSPEELMLKFDLTDVQLASAQRLPQFQKAVTAYRREIDETGTEFKLKARKLASELLPELAMIAADEDASHKDRIDAIREMARLAGYGKDDQQKTAGPDGFQVNITFNAQPGNPSIDVTPAAEVSHADG